MLTTESPAFRLATALAIGLLMGAERERRKGEGPGRSPAGIRTFAVAALLGGVSYRLGGEVLLAVTTLALAGFCAVAYWRGHDKDPGLTSETALLLAALLGGLAQVEIAIASGIAVVVTILLAARTPLHHFVRAVLSEQEVTDALIFVAAVLVVLPLTPNRYLGPFGAINPRTIWKIVILMISISAGGYIAVRLVGARFGLPVAGFASGFVSSTATIGAMGERAAHEPALARPAVAGAVLSNVATVIEMALVLAAISPPVLRLLRVPLTAAGIVGHRLRRLTDAPERSASGACSTRIRGVRSASRPLWVWAARSRWCSCCRLHLMRGLGKGACWPQLPSPGLPIPTRPRFQLRRWWRRTRWQHGKLWYQFWRDSPPTP